MPHPEAGEGPTVVTPAVLRQWALPAVQGDKESRGRVLVVGGGDRTPGAVLLAAEAALRCGAGKLQVATVDRTAATLAVALPEAMVVPLPMAPSGDIHPRAAEEVLELAQGCTAVLFGPGALDVETVAELLAGVVPELDALAVLDAGSLAYLNDDPARLRHLGGRVVLTPNLTELARVVGRDDEVQTDEVLRLTTELAARADAAVSSGGSTTVTTAADGRSWQDDAGGAGLGVSGSGDVKAGAVVGLAARGADPAQAAVWGSYLHARAGDRLAGQVGGVGYLARELPGQLPYVLSELAV